MGVDVGIAAARIAAAAIPSAAPHAAEARFPNLIAAVSSAACRTESPTAVLASASVVFASATPVAVLFALTEKASNWPILSSSPYFNSVSVVASRASTSLSR